MNKEQQIEEIKRVLISVYGRIRTGGEDFLNNRQAEALYNAGYRKVPYGAVDEITRYNSVEAELQELNIKYYNEAKDLRRELAKAKAENERLTERLKQVLLSIDTVKEMNTIARGIIDEYQEKAVKEFAEKLKEYINNKVMADFDDSESVEYYTINLDEFENEIDELLKEYE